jgi:hypothetical protein
MLGIIATGPIMARLAGMGVGVAVDGLMGALIGMRTPEFEAKRNEAKTYLKGRIR